MLRTPTNRARIGKLHLDGAFIAGVVLLRVHEDLRGREWDPDWMQPALHCSGSSTMI